MKPESANDPHSPTVPEPGRPGPLYPDRCLECHELATETYGSVQPNKCAACVLADLRRLDN